MQDCRSELALSITIDVKPRLRRARRESWPDLIVTMDDRKYYRPVIP